MDVSVVIPTRDRPEMLRLTLCSVLRQERVDVEVLVVDDGTGTGTETLIARMGDARLHLLRNTEPAGVSGARNTGVAAAKGRWVAFLDDDDLWAPGKLAAQLTAAAATDAAWVYGGHVTVNEALRVRSGAPPAPPNVVVTELRRHNAMPAGASNVVVRRDVLHVVGTFDPALRTSEDWDLWLRLRATGLPACVSRPLVALRTHAGMASRAVDRMLADIEVIAERHSIPIDRARHRRWAAWMCLEDGRRRAALGHYVHAVAAGDLTSLGRAALALVYTTVAHPNRSPPADSWAREAQEWIDALCREADDVFSTRAPHVGP